MAPTERWVPVFGFEGLYEVSNMGAVRSLPRKVEAVNQSEYMVRPRTLKPARRKSGHLHLVLRKGGEYHTRTVHRLVLESFVGPRPHGMECCHGNGNAADNRLANLRWDTPKANQYDRIAHGTGNQGFRNPKAFLTAEQIINIREAPGSDCSVARLFGVSPETARRIRRGTRWAEVVAE